MKVVVILLAVFQISVITVAAQTTDLSGTPPNTILVGVGPTLFGYGDITGIMQYTEYNRQVLPNFQAGVGFSLAQASATNYRWQQAAAKTLDFHFAFIPFHSARQNFKIGAGVSARRLIDIYSIGSRTYEQGNTPILVEEFEKQIFNSIGYTVLLEYQFFLAERWILGTRASFQNYKVGSTVLFLGINGGICF